MRSVRRVAVLAVEGAAACARLLVIEIGLRTRSLPTTCRWLRVAYDPADDSPAAAAAAALPPRYRLAASAAVAAIRHWPGGDTCLRRCLLLGHRLRRLEPVLRIGVRRTDTGTFAAHAWLELDGRPLDPGAADFAVLGTPHR